MSQLLECKFLVVSASGTLADIGTLYRLANQTADGTVVYSIDQFNGFSLNGAAFAPPPAGIHAVIENLSGGLYVSGGDSAVITGNCDRVSRGAIGLNTCEATIGWHTYTTPSTISAAPSQTLNDNIHATEFVSEFLLSVTELTAQLTIDLHMIRIAGDASMAAYAAKDLRLNCQYVILNWTITDSSEPVVTGSPIVVTGADNLDNVTSVRVLDASDESLICTVSSFTSQTATQLGFNLCNLGSFFGTLLLVAVCPGGSQGGTSFSGSVPLGELTVLGSDGSGIYVITPGATHDTIYSDSSSGDETQDVPIPRPFAKTGFIGS